MDRLQIEYETVQKIQQGELTREQELWVAQGYTQAMAAIDVGEDGDGHTR